MNQADSHLVQPSNTRALGLCVFLLGLVVGLVMVFGDFRSKFTQDEFDSYDFGKIGASVADGDGYEGFGTVLGRKGPLYPTVIGGVYFVFGENPDAVLAFQSILVGATCWLIFDTGRRLLNLRTAVLGAIFYALHPLTLRYVPDLHLETLLTFLFTLTIWSTLRFYDKPSISNGLLVGAVGGLAALTKPVVLLYPPLFAVIWVASVLLRRRAEGKPMLSLKALAPAVAIGIAMASVIAPWTIRNYYATDGQFVLITTGFADAFLRGYVFSEPEYALLQKPPYTDAENAVNDWFATLAIEAGTTFEKEDIETEQVLMEEAKRKLKAEPLEFVRKFGTGLFTFWYQMTSLTNSAIVGLAALGAWIFALIGLRRGWREDRPLWLLLVPIIQLNVFLAALLALGRYSAPIMPMLLMLAAFGVDTVLVGVGAVRSRIELSRA